MLLFPVLHRCHGNPQLRLQQNHNVQDEVLNPSSLISNSRHTCDFRLVLLLLCLSAVVSKLCFQSKTWNGAAMEKQTFISRLLCLFHRRQYRQQMKENLKVKPSRLPSSPTFSLWSLNINKAMAKFWIHRHKGNDIQDLVFS